MRLSAFRVRRSSARGGSYVGVSRHLAVCKPTVDDQLTIRSYDVMCGRASTRNPHRKSVLGLRDHHAGTAGRHRLPWYSARPTFVASGGAEPARRAHLSAAAGRPNSRAISYRTKSAILGGGATSTGRAMLYLVIECKQARPSEVSK
jgi:hypothetical protein